MTKIVRANKRAIKLIRKNAPAHADSFGGRLSRSLSNARCVRVVNSLSIAVSEATRHRLLEDDTENN